MYLIIYVCLYALSVCLFVRDQSVLYHSLQSTGTHTHVRMRACNFMYDTIAMTRNSRMYSKTRNPEFVFFQEAL